MDEQVRKSYTALVPPDIQECIRNRLLCLKGPLERKFEVSLSDYEGPIFLRYLPGGFFIPHRDESPENITRHLSRKLTATIFVNDEFQGGGLAIHSFSTQLIQPLAGSMVVFRSTSFHEVKPVISGERITIIGWFR
ncbi:2OG-Fe(II) oxygenase [bacterium]|nr:2OG-Fe(II) oxygenase [bacterium]